MDTPALRDTVSLMTALQKRGVSFYDASHRPVPAEAAAAAIDSATTTDLYVAEKLAEPRFEPLQSANDLQALGALYGETGSSDSVIAALRNMDNHGAMFFRERQSADTSHRQRQQIGAYGVWKQLPNRKGEYLGIVDPKEPAFSLAARTVREYFMAPQDVLVASCFQYGGDPAALPDPAVAANVQSLSAEGFHFSDKMGIGLMAETAWNELHDRPSSEDVLVGSAKGTLCWLTPERARQSDIVDTMRHLATAYESSVAPLGLPRNESIWLGEAVMRADHFDEPVEDRMRSIVRLLQVEHELKTPGLNAAAGAVNDFLALQGHQASSSEAVGVFGRFAPHMGRSEALGLTMAVLDHPLPAVPRDEVVTLLTELLSTTTPGFSGHKLSDAYTAVAKATREYGQLPAGTLRESMLRALFNGASAPPLRTTPGKVEQRGDDVIVGGLRIPRRPTDSVKTG